MIGFNCDSCGKSHSVKDEMTGKRAKCACGSIIIVPTPSLSIAPITTGANCKHCQATIQPHWKGCPTCGGALVPLTAVNPIVQNAKVSPRQETRAPAPTIQIGNDSVVTTRVNQSVNVAGGSPNPAGPFIGMSGHGQTGNMPFLQVGDGSVVKTEINSTNNINNDNSTNYQGGYVANQTVLQINSTSEMVKLLTGNISDQEIVKIEAQIRTLPNNPKQLLSILAQTLGSILREAKSDFKKTKGLFSSPELNHQKDLDFFDRFASANDFSGMSKLTKTRLKLCRQILDQINSIALSANDPFVNQSIETIDDALLFIEKVFGRLGSLKNTKIWIFCGSLGTATSLFGSIATAAPGAIIALLIFAPISFGIFYFYFSSQSYMEKKIKTCEFTLSRIISGDINTGHFQ